MPEASDVATAEGADWPAQAADKIVGIVGQVRDATTGKAITAARGAVYGLLAALLGSMVGIFAVIVSIRLIEEATEGLLGEKKVWIAYAILGLVFVIAGALLWRKRRPPEDD